MTDGVVMPTAAEATHLSVYDALTACSICSAPIRFLLINTSWSGRRVLCGAWSLLSWRRPTASRTCYFLLMSLDTRIIQ